MKSHHVRHADPAAGVFSQDSFGLEEVSAPTELRLEDGGVLHLRIVPVRNHVGGVTVRMFAYNGSIPGPLLRVRQGTAITVNVTNEVEIEQTVHWHGLRLENRYDGVPHETQTPIPVGGRFTYRLTFPDPGLYWYHPHIREDYGQEMGLYGQIIVDPPEPGYWPPCDTEIGLTLDDLLIEDGRLAPFQRSGATHTMMGRFGNVWLVNGQSDAVFAAGRGEVTRLYLTNTANTRIFNVALPGARVKLIGGDSGRYEQERFVDGVMLAPSERAIVDLLFDEPGRFPLEHHTPHRVDTLAAFDVRDATGHSAAAADFHHLRRAPELEAERQRLVAHRGREPDKTLRFLGAMDMGDMHHDMGGHDMAEAHEGSAMPHDMSEPDHGRPSHDAMEMDESGGPPMEHADEGIEWEDTMAEMNAMSDRSNMTWQIVDAETGAVNHEIFWTFNAGDRVKIRLDNTGGSDHDMHHPFHIHGAGRFLVLDRDGVPDDNLVWKDTVLVRSGEVVDILFDVTNPGRWMAHCHIAEHTESGMMFSFDVLAEEAS